MFFQQLFSGAEQLEDLDGDVAVLLGAGEFAGTGAVGEEGHHHRRVALGAEDAADVAGLGVGAGEVRGAGLMVGADDHERVAVLLGETDRDLDGLVEIKHLGDRAGEVVGMLAYVDAGTLDHEEEAFPAARGEVVDGHLRGGGEVVAAVELDGLGQIDEALGAGDGRVGGVIDHGEGLPDGLLRERRHALEGGLRAGGSEFQGAGGQVGPDPLLVAAGGLVGEESRRGGAVEVVRGHDAAGIAHRGQDLRDVGDVHAGGVFPEEAVVGLGAGGVGGAGGGGVRGEVTGGLGAHEAEGLEVGQGELAAVGIHARVHGAMAHAVADQEDDVADPGVLAVHAE